MGYIYRDRQQRDRALDNFKRAAYLFEWQQNTAKYQAALEEMTKLERSPTTFNSYSLRLSLKLSEPLLYEYHPYSQEYFWFN